MNHFENRFKFLEDDIEVRIESIITAIDNKHQAVLNFVDNFEATLLDKTIQTTKKTVENRITNWSSVIKSLPYKKISARKSQAIGKIKF